MDGKVSFWGQLSSVIGATCIAHEGKKINSIRFNPRVHKSLMSIFKKNVFYLSKKKMFDEYKNGLYVTSLGFKNGRV